MRLLEIGEAVKVLSPQITSREPDIKWRDITGMRDFLAHHRRSPRSWGCSFALSSGWTTEPRPLRSRSSSLTGPRSASEIRFIEMIIDHLTSNGVVEARRLYESSFTDYAPHGPDMFFTNEEVDQIIVILDQVRSNAAPDVTVA